MRHPHYIFIQLLAERHLYTNLTQPLPTAEREGTFIEADVFSKYFEL